MTAQAGDGLSGFSDQDLPLAAGSLTGVRLWHMDVPSAMAVLNGAPAPAGGLLAGVFGGTWRQGENVAVCGGGHRPPARHADPVPAARCGCGFWAYWTPRDALRSDYRQVDVVGIMQGYGRTRIGTRGCRCSKARIVALHLPGIPWDFQADSLRRQEVAEVLARYYGVPCYPSLEEMLAAHPPTTDYLPRRRRRVASPPAPRPAAPARPATLSWLRLAVLAAVYAILAATLITLTAWWSPSALTAVTAITVASGIWPIGTRWLPRWARKLNGRRRLPAHPGLRDVNLHPEGARHGASYSS